MKFHVPDMSCGHCRAAIEQAAVAAGGSATVDLDSKTVTVEGLDAARAAQAIAEAGFTPSPAD
ncbi:cation transporter [Paracoccus alkenifer]|uniref:Copper chaperone n=1 Tax=Paracoccus alkenifer TaxID=65735 RepID=A0A1H6LSC4_9RHOB|nr:cation transporter [Paracoccus alkenifer]SEH87864.1 copper chaperone [Paracoccus alkenifer]